MLAATACTKPATSGVKKMSANQEYLGLLKDYSKLAANPDLEGAVKTYVNADAQKNVHRYVAVIVDPVEVYLASDADDTKIQEKARAAAATKTRCKSTPRSVQIPNCLRTAIVNHCGPSDTVGTPAVSSFLRQ